MSSVAPNTLQDLVIKFPNCPICLEEFNASDLEKKVTRLGCDHIFHFECLQQWISKKSTCPSCRAAVPIPLSTIIKRVAQLSVPCVAMAFKSAVDLTVLTLFLATIVSPEKFPFHAQEIPSTCLALGAFTLSDVSERGVDRIRAEILSEGASEDIDTVREFQKKVRNLTLTLLSVMSFMENLPQPFYAVPIYFFMAVGLISTGLATIFQFGKYNLNTGTN